MKLILSIITVLCLVFMLGCGTKSVVAPIVKKMYSATIKVESYVIEASATNLVTKLQKVDTTLTVVGKALDFIATKVKDEKAKTNIELAANTITEIVTAISTIDVLKIDETKILILQKLDIAKNAIEEVAKWLKIPLDAVEAAGVVAITAEHLDAITAELEAELK